MELIIAQCCPSCGAHLTVKEDARLIQCDFCDVTHYRWDTGIQRYVLPFDARDVDVSDVFYLPYLRFKGSLFYVNGIDIQNRFIELTHLAIGTGELPPSLGLRSQVMKINPVLANTPGKFIHSNIPVKELFLQAMASAEILSSAQVENLIDLAFIGRTVNVIYQPCYNKGEMIFDAVLHRSLCQLSLLQEYFDSAQESKLDWEPHYISMTCPNCSGLLKGSAESVAFPCPHCSSVWKPRNHKFEKIAWSIIPSDTIEAQYLPFWKVTLLIDDQKIRTFADYLEFTNQTIRVNDRYKDVPLAFYIPAWKMSPKSFLKAAAHLTMSQWKLSSSIDGMVDSYPITLEAKEAEQAIKSVIATTMIAKQKHLPLLKNLDILVEKIELIYVPFCHDGYDLVQNHTGLALPLTSLQSGRF